MHRKVIEMEEAMEHLKQREVDNKKDVEKWSQQIQTWLDTRMGDREKQWEAGMRETQGRVEEYKDSMGTAVGREIARLQDSVARCEGRILLTAQAQEKEMQAIREATQAREKETQQIHQIMAKGRADWEGQMVQMERDLRAVVNTVEKFSQVVEQWPIGGGEKPPQAPNLKNICATKFSSP